MPAPESPDAILTPELAAFVHGGVVVMVGSASPDLAPALTRGFAPRVAPDRRSLEVFVGGAQGATCLANQKRDSDSCTRSGDLMQQSACVNRVNAEYLKCIPGCH